MNAAFRRSEALETLEHMSFTIIAHMALIAWFPKNEAKNHWEKEIAGFLKTILRYNRGKIKSGKNLSASLVEEILLEEIALSRDEERIEIFIQEKGLELPEPIDWQLVRSSISKFAGNF